jgi:hypothetical protein
VGSVAASRKYRASPHGRRARGAYERSEAGRSRRRAAGAAYRSTPEGRLKTAARGKVAYAVRQGRLTILPCEVCGAARVQAHHPFGYVGDMALAVWWLCSHHHYGMHRAIGEGAT